MLNINLGLLYLIGRGVFQERSRGGRLVSQAANRGRSTPSLVLA